MSVSISFEKYSKGCTQFSQCKVSRGLSRVGDRLVASGGGDMLAARVAVNTMLASAGGCVVGMLVSEGLTGYIEPGISTKG